MGNERLPVKKTRSADNRRTCCRFATVKTDLNCFETLTIFHSKTSIQYLLEWRRTHEMKAADKYGQQLPRKCVA